MADLALVTNDTAHAAATNTKDALENKLHTVTFVLDSALGTHDFSPYDVLLFCRLDNTTAVANAVRALLNLKPSLVGTAHTGFAGTKMDQLTTKLKLSGLVDYIINSTGIRGSQIGLVAHPITAGFTLGADVLFVNTACFWGLVATGGIVAKGVPLCYGHTGFSEAWGRHDSFAIEAGTLDLNGNAILRRCAVLAPLYGGQGTYNANGEKFLDQAVAWVLDSAPSTPASSLLNPGVN